MKLHLPVKLFRAVLACMAAVAFVSFTSATSTCFAATEEEEENDLLMLLSEPEYPNGSIIYTTRQTSALTLTEYESILFKDISSNVSYGGAIGNWSSTFTMNGNENVIFIDNTAKAGAGAIYNSGSNSIFTLCGNEAVTFSRNAAPDPDSGHGKGGAISNIASCTFELNGNGNVNFSENTAAFGGAIDNGGIFTLYGNETVTFSENTAALGGAIYNNGSVTYNDGTFMLNGNGLVAFIENTGTDYAGNCNGGAIFNGGNRGAFSLCDNEDVIFSGNALSSLTDAADGGAVYNGGGSTFTMSGNDFVTFSGNTASSSTGALGGAIGNFSSNFSLSNNGNVSFCENAVSSTTSDARGGAIYHIGGSTFTLSGNDSVTFSGNTASSSTGALGGAIGNDGNFTLSNNGKVYFRENFCYSEGNAQGGAIHNTGIFTLSGNGDVLIEKNVEVNDWIYCLKSIASWHTLNLASPSGNSITFHDSLYAYGTVNLNQYYTDSEGVVRKSTGDIIFTGATTEDDLREVKGGVDGTSSEIANSRTSVIATMTNLYGGRLIVEDKAILRGQGITAAADSGATVRVKDGSLSHSGYALTFNNSTMLEAEGVNTVTASSVDMLAGSTLSFVLGEANLTTAALTLTGTLTTETISIAISGLDESELGNDTYALLSATTYDTSAWTADKITVVTEGVSFENLVWKNGTLYLNYIPDLTAATWTNASGDGLWNASSLNWTQDGHSYAYADGVDVIFGNEGAGTVSLVGDLAPKSVLVDNGSGFDYTFAGDGKLTGTTALTKQGEGKLTINTANDYTGGTAINGGTLVAGDAAALGTGAVAVNGGTLQIAANGIANDTTFTGTSSLVVDAGYQLALSKVLANSGVLTVSGTLNASSLTLNTIAATHVDVNGNSGASGFAKGAIYSVQVVNGGTAAGADATITHLNLPTGETLVLGENGVATAGGAIDYSEYLLTDSATAATSAIHAKGASATVTQNGGTLTVDDTVTVATTGGAIALNGGALNGAISGATINATSGALNATLSGNNTLNGTNYALQSVIANSGALTVSGTINAAALTLDTTAATYIDVNGNSGASGFAKDAIYAVTIANGTTVNSGATITHGEHTLTLGTDGVAKTGGAIDYSEYLLTGSATAATSAIHAKGASATVTQNGGTLTVDDAVTVTTTGGTIALNGGTLNGAISGATINATSGALNAALSGNNTFNGTNYALQSVIANSGVLTVSGTINAAALTLDTTAATHIDVNGNSGASGFAKDAIYAVTIADGTTVNSGATITHGEHTLTLGTDGVAKTGGAIDYSEYLLTGSATAATSAIHGVEGAANATVTQNGGTLTVDDTVTVNGTGGAITLNGGTLNGSLQGMTIDAVAGTLAATLTGTNTLIGHDFALNSPLNNQGTLVLNGTFDLSGMTPTTSAPTHIDVNGNSGASGFAKTELQEVTIATGGTINASGATFKHNGHTLTLGEDGVASVGGEVDYSEYLLTGSDTASSSAIHGVAGAANATVTQTGGTLTVDDTVTVATTAGSIELNGGTLNGTVSGATINASSGALNATLSGENTLNGNNYALGSVIDNQGTLTVSGAFDASALELNTTDATHIDVNGNSGASGFAKDAFYDVTIATGSVVNNGAAVTHGEHTLVLGSDGVATAGGAIDYSEYLLTGSDTVSSSAIHGVEGAANATVTQTGGTLTVDDTVTVNGTGGAITLNGGTLNGSLQGMTIDAVAGTLAATLTGTNTLIGHDFALNAPLNNQGTLVLNGTFDLSGMTPTTSASTHIDVNGNSGASGFAKTELQEVTIATGGTINASGATFTHNGNTLTLGEDGVASVGGAIDYSNYLLTGSDTASSSAIHGVGGAANAMVTQTGGTLTVDDTVTVATTAGTIVLNGGTLNGTVSGATINATSGALKATLSGNNTLNGNNYALGSVIDNQDVLTISGTFDVSALTLNTTAATHIDVNGASGANGFAKDAFYAVTMAHGTTVNAGATIIHGSHTLTLGTDGVATAGGTVDYGTYFLHNGAEVAVSAIRTIPEATDAKVDMDGGKLAADADVFVKATGGRIEVSHGADVAGSIRDTQIAIHGCEISADITGSSSVYVDGDTILSGHNTFTGNTEVHEDGYLTVSGSITSDVYLYAGTLDTATGMTLASGQDIFLRGGQVKGNMATASGSGLNLNQNSTLDGSLTLGGGTLTLSNGAVLTVSGSLTLNSPTKLVGDWEADHVYTLVQAGSITNNSGDLNAFFDVDEALGTVKQEGTRLILDTLRQPELKPDAADYAVVNSLWGSLSTIRDFARLVEQQRLIGTPGQTTLWAGAFGSFMDVSDAHGFSANSGGYAVGVQHAFTQKLRSGFAVGQSTGTVESKGAERFKDDQQGMMAALSVQYEQLQKGKNSLLFNGYAAIGKVENDAKGAVNADWDDTVMSIGGRASYALACGESAWVMPFVGLEWSHAEQGDVSRADGSRYSGGEMDLLTLPVGVSMRKDFTLANGVVLAPELTLAYEANIVKDAPQNTRRKGTSSCTVEGYDPGEQSFMLNASFNVLFNANWSAGASYTIRAAENSVNQSVNASVRYMF